MEFSEFELANSFARDGFVKCDSVLDADRLRSLHDLAMANFNEALSTLSSNDIPIGIGIKEGFKDIVQRHPCRFEMPYKMDTSEFEIIFETPALMGLVHAILGEDAVVINKSLIVSLPGAKDQSWHIDGPHVDVHKYLPCHCLNVFVPLVDVDMQNGPTEFRPESQRITQDLTKQFLAAFMSKRLRTPVIPNIAIGSAVLFDYRVLHRGRANLSPCPRPVLVYTFAKPWHRDTLNFPKFTIADAVAKKTSLIAGASDSSHETGEEQAGETEN